MGKGFSSIACVFFLFISVTICSAQNWKKIKAEYESIRPELERRGIPDNYKLNCEGKIIVSDGSPELGINAHALNEKVIIDAKKAGICYIRQTIYWYHIENTVTKGRYNRQALKELDDLISLYEKHELQQVFVIHGNAPGCSFDKREEAYQRFANFMAMLAGRYKYVKYWQLWNEMDVSFTDLFGARNKVSMKQRGEYYVKMLKLSYPAIKQANPEALVLTGGLVNCKEFPTAMYESGGKNLFDIMCLHTYGVPLIWSFVNRGAELRKIMDSYGDQDKPLWNTEFGINASALVQAWGIPKKDPAKYYDDKQKEMIVDCIKFNRKAGLYQKYFIYVYQGKAEFEGKMAEKIKKSLSVGANLDNYGFGLVRCDGTPRPAMTYIFDNQPSKAGVAGNLRLKD